MSSISTVHVRANDLPPVLLRRPFEQALNRDKVPVITPDGQPTYYAEAAVPGKVNGRFDFDPGLGAIRLRVLGGAPSVATDGPAIVRLEGRVTLSATYNRGQRMSDRLSHVTITAEHVRQVTGERPAGRGFLPVDLPVPGVLLDARPMSEAEPGARWVADVALEASSSYVVNGMAELVVAGPVPEDLLGRRIRPVELSARYTLPDTLDVSQRTRAELLLSCAYLEAVEGIASPPPAPRGRRGEEPQSDGEAA